jgi:dipeptidyl aminopeptidase/acylaminoacyl peptidase
VDSVSENILEVESFRSVYHEKTNSASINYIAWSHTGNFIVITVGNIYTSDCDDIWVISTHDKSIHCITSIFLRDNQHYYRIPVWKNADTLVFSTPKFNVIYDVVTNKLVSQLKTSDQTEPSYFSPNGELRLQEEENGNMIWVCTREGKKIITIGERDFGGSVLGRSFSTDSRLLFYEQLIGHGVSHIMMADMKSLSLYIMKLSFNIMSGTYGVSNWYPGKDIFHITDDQGGLHFLDVASRSDRTFNIPDYYIQGAAWSPDGSNLALILQNKKGGADFIRILKNPITN